ncbi:MAG: PDC sensor domain-containing protein [Nitrospirota bacterium]
MKMMTCFVKFWMVGLVVGSLIISSTGCGKKEEGKKGVSEKEVAVKAEKIVLSKEVEQILEKKMGLIKKLAADSLIIKATRESNQKNKDTTLSEILRLDNKWKKAEGMDEFIKSFITNECAQYLMDFQEANEGFPEVFIADEKGLIVAETNRTSDYYQADEDWWINTYDKGRGKSYHGEIEYDESARAEAIALYVPVMDPETKRAIGVIKVICDITAIKMEL